MATVVQTTVASGRPVGDAAESRHRPDLEAACGWLLGRKRAAQIVRVLLPGPHRFPAIRAVIPELNDKILTRGLGEFQVAGIVARTQYRADAVSGDPGTHRVLADDGRTTPRARDRRDGPLEREFAAGAEAPRYGSPGGRDG